MAENVKRILLYVALFFLVVIALPLLVPLLIGSFIANWLNKRRFQHRFRDFLQAYNGYVFFCYANSGKHHTWVKQHILPLLDPEINVVFVQDRVPVSDFDPRCISYMLDNVTQEGCPAVLLVKNGV
ncbi:MAG: hypothetical protein P1S60_18350, partial [Anaerolineae bacterium]|nr:hypothetical protein [Anaerolineae bacterium]